MTEGPAPRTRMSASQVHPHQGLTASVPQPPLLAPPAGPQPAGHPPSGPPPSAPAGDGYLLETRFSERELTGLRHEVGRYAAAAGLVDGPADDFVLAVNEAMSNAVRHGGGGGLMKVWRNGELVCEISDDGPGFDVPGREAPQVRPEPSASGGLGLWLASQVSDSLSIESGPGGTTVRVGARIPIAPRGDEPAE